MSSSHRKNQLHNNNIKLECFNCGALAMEKQKGNSILEDGFLVHNLERWICLKCHEEAFDDAAMKEIDKQRALKIKAA
jgi:YgiT-type zinc finger domain-containing protein